LHSLLYAVNPEGLRVLQPIPNVAAWMACFDLLQVNEDEMRLLAPDAMALAATAIAEGVSVINVTLGARGIVYFATSGFERLSDIGRIPLVATGATEGPIRTTMVPAAPTRDGSAGDPTGCGDVWGATYFARLLVGDNLGDATTAALLAAARNVDYRGATGLAPYLRGELSVT
jgi:sugar/nucleoside kinase (ribokinase family)